MRTYVAIVYNQPQTSRYDGAHEEKAVLGVLEAVAAVHESLLELGYGVSLLPLTPPWPEAREELESLDADVVFNLFEGFCGEPETEALVPQTLAELKIPFTGCPAPALRLALDKAKVKVILQAAGIPTPDFQLLNPRTLHLFRLGFPCIVKPRGEDASHGITAASVVRDAASLEKQVTAMSRSYGCVLVEAFVGGREFNATVMGNSRYRLLPPSEINYSLPPDVPPILTFDAKWDTDSAYFKGTQVTCPAEITPGELKRIRR
ncbi:MAG: hypothetical protein ABID71_06680, partial [Chloroflexota bacterium]